MGLGLVCPAVPVLGQNIWSRAEFADFFWQPWQKALIYFDSSAERIGWYSWIDFVKPHTLFSWGKKVALLMCSLLGCLRHILGNWLSEVTLKNSASWSHGWNAYCLPVIFILASCSATSSSWREFRRTSLCCYEDKIAESWRTGLCVRVAQRVWIMLSARRGADECWIVLGETEFCWKNGESELGYGGVETERTQCCATRGTKEREKNVSWGRTTGKNACGTTSVCPYAWLRRSRDKTLSELFAVITESGFFVFLEKPFP